MHVSHLYLNSWEKCDQHTFTMFLYASSSYDQRYSTFYFPLHHVSEGQASQTPTTSHFNRRVRQYSPTCWHNRTFHIFISESISQVRCGDRVWSNKCKIVYIQPSLVVFAQRFHFIDCIVHNCCEYARCLHVRVSD